MDNIKIKGSTTSILFTHETKEKENQFDENIHKILFKKYKIKTKIGKSSSIQIYEGINLSSKTQVIIKMESKTDEELYLESEALNLYLFKDLGIPKIITCGKTKTSVILIEEKLGPSLYKLFIENKRKFSLNEICCIGIQCIERLKNIHSKNYIHRNIKPENFKIGIKDPHIIYLQNFYLCEKFKSSTTNKHAKLSLSNKIVGTERYGSVDALKGLRQGRKDDLESLCYMLIYFFLGKLPWQDIKAENEGEKYKKLLNEKKKFNIDNYKEIIPKEFRTIFKLIKNLKFDETPKYSLYIRLLQNIREQNQCFDQNDFFWVKKDIEIKKNNIKSKKEGFRERLFLKLNTMKTEIKPVFDKNNFNFDNIGNDYIDEDLNNSYDDVYTGKFDVDINEKEKINLDNINNNKKEKEENKEEINDNLEMSESSNSSIDTKVYRLNDNIKTFLRKNIDEDVDINNNDVIKNLEKNETNEINMNNSNTIKEKNKLNYTIDEKVEEENSNDNHENVMKKIIEKEKATENKIESIKMNEIIVTNYSTPNTKAGSVSISNIKESKESKEKENTETPSLIIVKKNSGEINEINKQKNDLNNINRFGQIKGPEMDLPINNSKQGKTIKNKDKDCIIF